MSSGRARGDPAASPTSSAHSATCRRCQGPRDAHSPLCYLISRPECSMPDYRSKTSTHGRNMAGARALWRATGMKDADFKKPIIAIANSFTQFVPGHVHLRDLGQLVAREIE